MPPLSIRLAQLPSPKDLASKSVRMVATSHARNSDRRADSAGCEPASTVAAVISIDSDSDGGREIATSGDRQVRRTAAASRADHGRARPRHGPEGTYSGSDHDEDAEGDLSDGDAAKLAAAADDDGGGSDSETMVDIDDRGARRRRHDLMSTDDDDSCADRDFVPPRSGDSASEDELEYGEDDAESLAEDLESLSAAEVFSDGEDGENSDLSILFSSDDDDDDRDSLMLSDEDAAQFRTFKLNTQSILAPGMAYGRRRLKYTLSKEDMPRSIRHDLKHFKHYCTAKIAPKRWPKGPMQLASYTKLEEKLRGLLGYLEELTQGQCFAGESPQLEDVLWDRRHGLLGYMHYLNDRRLCKVRIAPGWALLILQHERFFSSPPHRLSPSVLPLPTGHKFILPFIIRNAFTYWYIVRIALVCSSSSLSIPCRSLSSFRAGLSTPLFATMIAVQ